MHIQVSSPLKKKLRFQFVGLHATPHCTVEFLSPHFSFFFLRAQRTIFISFLHSRVSSPLKKKLEFQFVGLHALELDALTDVEQEYPIFADIVAETSLAAERGTFFLRCS